MNLEWFHNEQQLILGDTKNSFICQMQTLRLSRDHWQMIYPLVSNIDNPIELASSIMMIKVLHWIKKQQPPTMFMHLNRWI